MEKQTNKISWFNNQAAKFEENRYGAMAIMLTFQSCLGSVAAMFSLKLDSYVLLAFCAMFTMGANAALIALAPPKWCLSAFYSSVIISAIIILINFII